MPPQWVSAGAGATISSTSTVTTTSSSATASRSSSSRDASPERTTRRWAFEEIEEEDLRIADELNVGSNFVRHRPTTPSGRILPRCGLVNFTKDGDTLRWAPRVSRNFGGVAARVHNFEDAFSLEEFSSRALPVVWQSTGGDPRPSIGPEDRERKESSQRFRFWKDEAKGSSGKVHLRPDWGDRARGENDGPGHRVKQAMGVTNEMRRPSFWSSLTQGNQGSGRVRGHFHRRESQDRRRASMEPGMMSSKVTSQTKRNGWGAMMGFRLSRGRGRSTDVRSDASLSEDTMPFSRPRKNSLLRRLVPHFEKHSQEEEELMNEIRSRRFDDRDKAEFHSDDEDELQGGIRLGRRHRSIERVYKREPSSSGARRIRSSLDKLGPRRLMMSPVNPDDDQYVTFMTSMA